MIFDEHYNIKITHHSYFLNYTQLNKPKIVSNINDKLNSRIVKKK